MNTTLVRHSIPSAQGREGGHLSEREKSTQRRHATDAGVGTSGGRVDRGKRKARPASRENRTAQAVQESPPHEPHRTRNMHVAHACRLSMCVVARVRHVSVSACEWLVGIQRPLLTRITWSDMRACAPQCRCRWRGRRSGDSQCIGVPSAGGTGLQSSASRCSNAVLCQ